MKLAAKTTYCLGAPLSAPMDLSKTMGIGGITRVGDDLVEISVLPSNVVVYAKLSLLRQILEDMG